ncbi:MAG: VCBS repeat-containing protein [Planctomycetota bacterium]
MDILSGTYSRMDQDMAGTFQVLYGSEEGFKVAEELNGTDGEPLIIPATEENMLRKICTRPFACDMDNDGDLDLVVGNFEGTFYMFEGEGDGEFNPEPTQMMDADGDALAVGHHSDPFMFDWDSDGDLDIISGSSSGGVSMAVNNGTAEEADFSAFEEIIKAGEQRGWAEVVIGSEHITGPQGSTRVWVDDVNDDGKFDLIVGDSVTISTLGEGVEEDEVDALLAEWEKEQAEVTGGYQEFMEEYQEFAMATPEEKEEMSDEEREEMEAKLSEYQEAMSAVYEKRSQIIDDQMTGYVWVYHQK